MVRIVFVGIFSWLIYAPRAAAAAFVTMPGERAVLFPAERAMFGFGIGIRRSAPPRPFCFKAA